MSKWRRPATKTYDYNYKLGEHYYKPQLDYLETRKGRAKSPPTAKTFAERFAEDPIYGNYNGPNLRRTGLGDGNYGESNIPAMSKYGSMDDIGIGQSNRRQQLLDDLDSLSHRAPSTPRLIVGDRLLDSVGIQESKLSQPIALTSALSSSSKLQSSEGMEQSSSSSTFGRRRMQVGFVQSAGADMVSDDPFKTRISAKLQAARKQADDMLDDMTKESDSSVSRFRARLQQRKEEQLNKREQVSTTFGFADEDDDTAAMRSRINKIGERARARIAQLDDDDFPEIQIGSSLASRRAATNAASSYSNDEDNSRVASKTLKISKRTVRASYDVE